MGRRCDTTDGIPPSPNACVTPSCWSETDEVGDEAGPTQRRLGPDRHDHVATRSPGGELDSGPFDRARRAVDQADGGARLLKVDDVADVVGAEHAPTVELRREHRGGERAGVARVDPARQRDHEHRVAEAAATSIDIEPQPVTVLRHRRRERNDRVPVGCGP